MILCLDVGNSHIFGGVFHNDIIKLRFRYPSNNYLTSDQLGTFLKSVLRENHVDPEDIEGIALCSVVPSLDYSLRAAFIKYFDKEPFILQPGVKTGLKIKVQNPQDVGSDRIASAIAAVNLFPSTNLMVVDFGTATTFEVISKNSEYLGGIIMPGIKTAMEALHMNAARLSPVQIVRPDAVVGTTTAANIQSGLYYSQLGALKEVSQRIAKEMFRGDAPTIIGTGGFAQLFEEEQIFHEIVSDLVLQGIRWASEKN